MCIINLIVPKESCYKVLLLVYVAIINSFSIGNCVALDCEMVGAGPKGSIAMVGRCAVVNHHGHVLLDAMVAPYAPVTDYRTKYSGLRKTDFVDGKVGYL